MVLKEIRRSARESLVGKWGSAIGSVLIVFALAFFLPGIFFYEDTPRNDALMTIWLILVYSPFVLGLARVFLHIARNQTPKGALFSYLTNGQRYLKSVWFYVLQSIYLFLWTLLLVIPGIIKGYSYAMTSYILVDHPEYSVNQAITKSRELMNGYKWKLFLLQLSFIGWFFLSLLTFGIGFIWLAPYYQAAGAQFYLTITGKRETA
ncbi:DUF975 family protein [Salinithrix halophila]|uniref:DUF975 family protein n=1 Tax=Salinithrix halophila TaxID=1485204 RepID=A0ABV8JFA1_9BACL